MDKENDKKYCITVNADQLFYLEHACETMARLTCGQLFVMQEICERAFERNNKETNPIGSEKWYDMRQFVEQSMSELRRVCWEYKGTETKCLGYSDDVDDYWDMYQCLRKARYDYVFDDKEREEMKNTVMSHTPMHVGDKPLIKILPEKN